MRTPPDASVRAGLPALLALPALLFAGACSTPGTVETDPPIKILALASDYSVQQDRGRSPVPLAAEANLERFKFDKQGGRAEYLLVMFPSEASGPIKIKLATDPRSRASVDDGGYFDAILRAQRFLLKGRLVEATALVDDIERRFGLRYGTAVLGLTLAVYKRDRTKFQDLLDTARALAPDDDARAQLKEVTLE